MATTTQLFSGIYELDPNHSSIQFAVRHMKVSTFRASFGDINGRLVADDGDLVLEGRALAESRDLRRGRPVRRNRLQRATTRNHRPPPHVHGLEREPSYARCSWFR